MFDLSDVKEVTEAGLADVSVLRTANFAGGLYEPRKGIVCKAQQWAIVERR